ncbi:exodeoxyribonuclease V subunit alpha, partial [Candidatus Venteria ishoeyi]|uniref:exodeoxyribonuclease V subunit alpha n=1 Tax=Candidatus Venteria ishoeyi TaxID=1899563 RepID=UPI000A94B3BF
RQSLKRLFPDSGKNKALDWQQIAVLVAMLRPFCVISGGPGTGKTTTVVKLLALLLEQAHTQNKPLSIALLTPTGKAAVRLQESINASRQQLACHEHIRAAIPTEAATIHRWLGTIPGSPHFRFNADNPRPVDVVIVDEASMVDLMLMTRLLQALPSHTRLILLGDKDQLASVETGAVLGDLYSAAQPSGFSPSFSSHLADFLPQIPEPNPDTPAASLQDSVLQLHKSYRFDSRSGIGQLAKRMNTGDSWGAFNLLKQPPPDNSLHWIEPGAEDSIRDQVIQGFQTYLEANTAQTALSTFNQFRVLCAHREGEAGVRHWNQQIESWLEQAGLLQTGTAWYIGRPVMILRNDYQLKLFNGDIGLILPEHLLATDKTSKQQQRLVACFPTPEGGLRYFSPLRLPAHETAFAMTVHKSQGSEFNKILLVLPASPSPVLSRELLYTAITRARQQVQILSHASLFRQAVSHRLQRTSGLGDALLSLK